MNTTIIVAIISFLGTGCGSILGILQANKLMVYRIKKLEEKVNQHNNLIERMYKVEDRAKSNSHRLDTIENAIIK